MSEAIKIKSGARLQLAYDVPPDKDPQFNMASTFFKSLDESAFLISVPMRDGKALAFDETQKFLIRYNTATDPMILSGYPDDEVREGIRRYWKIRRVTEQRQFFKRADERLKVALRVRYGRDTALPGEENSDTADGLTLDISAGGLAMFAGGAMDVGELINVTLPRVGTTPEGRAIEDVPAVVCWGREAPRGSMYRRIFGLQYRLDDGKEKERMQDYVSNVKKKYKL